MVRLLLCGLLLFASCAASLGQVPAGTTGQGEPLPPPVAPAPGGATPNAAVTPPPEATPPAPAPLPPAAEAPRAPNPIPGAPETAPDPGADADFVAARARFDGGDREGARAALEGFVARHPAHGARGQADLMLARLALLRGDVTGATTLLEPLTATPPEGGVASSARYYLGIADVRLGRFAPARELLLPFLPRAGSAGPGDEALVELRGALAEATAGVGELPAAVAIWDAYERGARAHEKSYARQKATELAAEIPPEAAARTYAAMPPHGLGRAVLGAKAADAARAQGDASAAASIASDTVEARRAVGFEDVPARSSAGDPTRIGLVAPLSGKFQPIGEAAMRAAMLATGTPSTGTSDAPLQLAVRDTASDADRAARGLAELTEEESVIGVVSANDRKAAAAALAQASREGIPFLSLDDAAPGADTTAFQLIHAPEARAQELARRALKLGARDFALLGPDSATGKRLRDAFRREVTGAGGRITGEATYVVGATSFQAAIATLKKTPPQAIFVADGADRLELIAPALAFADLWPAPWGTPAPKTSEPGKPRVRNVLLLSTANDLSQRLVQSAGRYVQGALLAPGFYADVSDAAAKSFSDAYRTAYGHEPRATEAYAFDGVNALRAAAATGGHTRADVLRALASGSFEGLTGTLRFGPDHARVDPARVYVVSGEQIKLSR
ncbi:MAG: Extracellular ligand-binding receptor [Myxococcales bacterium]|nr:Extracellular ligand-binding receptor [Myxococcales bacterium]